MRGRNTLKTHGEFLNDISEINKYIEILGLYTKAKDRIETKCLKCGGIWFPTANKLLSGDGCPFCRKGVKKILVGFNDLWTNRPEIARLLLNPEDGYKYSQRSAVKLDWKCPICGSIIRNKSIDSVVSYKLVCSLCSDGISYPNKIMFSLLNQLNINFETEKTFKWCKFDVNNKISKGRYDFYFKFNNKEYIVEMDGNWHNIDNNINGQTKEESQAKDAIKDILAKNHNIRVIRIDSRISNIDYIRNNIIDSELSTIFDLLRVNWKQCHNESNDSYKLKASEMWNDGLTTGEIAIAMNKHTCTIMEWLKDCSSVGLCDYDVIKSKKRAREKQGSPNKSKVFCIDLDKNYESIQEASKSTNINAGSISMCCRNKRKTAGNLRWEYAC